MMMGLLECFKELAYIFIALALFLCFMWGLEAITTIFNIVSKQGLIF